MSASAKGFETVVQKNVKVDCGPGEHAEYRAEGGQRERSGDGDMTSTLVDTSNSTVGQLIGAETIDRVPLLTRNVFDLVQLSAGVTPANGAPNSSSSYAIQNISSGRPGVDVSSYTINGAIVGSVYYMVDGSPLGIAENNAAAIIPALDIPEDGVEETRVETQNTPASYQSGGAGVISVVTSQAATSFMAMFSVFFGPMFWRRTNTSISRARSATAKRTSLRRFIATRRARPSAAPFCTTSFSFLAITRRRSRSSSTARTFSLCRPARSVRAIFPMTTSLSTTQRSRISPPARWREHGSLSRTTSSPIRTRRG